LCATDLPLGVWNPGPVAYSRTTRLRLGLRNSAVQLVPFFVGVYLLLPRLS